MRLARPGDVEHVARFMVMAGVEFPDQTASAIEAATIAHAIVAALERGQLAIAEQLYAMAHSDDSSSESAGLTTVLVAEARDGEPVGALMAFPPFGVLSDCIRQGFSPDDMLTLAGVVVRFSGLGVNEAARGLGVGSALIRGALRLYAQIGYVLIYGLFPVGRGLEHYYPRFGFDVLGPGASFTLDWLGPNIAIRSAPHEQPMLQWVTKRSAC